jgi:hypothetical protein
MAADQNSTINGVTPFIPEELLLITSIWIEVTDAAAGQIGEYIQCRVQCPIFGYTTAAS